MKVRRTIGGALFGIGCAVTFVGILATVLPMVQNDQLQLVLSSFEMPSGNLIVSAINGAMTYALHHCYGVLLCGIVMMAAGMAILLHRTRRRPVRHNTPSSYSRPASAPAPKPVWPEEDADWSAWSRGKQGQIPLREQSMRSFPPARRLRQFRRPIPRLPSCRPPMPRMNLRPMHGRLRRHPRLPLQRIPRCRLLRRLPHRKHRNRLPQKLPMQHQPCQSRQQRQYRRLPRNSALLPQRRLWPPLAPRPVHPARAAHV